MDKINGRMKSEVDRQTNKWIIISEIQIYKQNNDIRYVVLHLLGCIDVCMYLNVQDNNI